MKWALTVLLVLSAPLALYSAPTTLDLPAYISRSWSEGLLFTGGGLWNLFGRLIGIFWLACAGWVIALWWRKRSAPPSRTLNFLVGGVLLLLTAVTVFFVYVFWAWSQM